MAESGTIGKISFNRYGYRFNGEGPFQRVTTILGKKSKGDALTDWAARMVAEKAKELAEMFRDKRISSDQLVVGLLSEELATAHRTVRDTAADFGTLFHHLLENISAGDQDALHIAEREIRVGQIEALAGARKVKIASDRDLRLFEQSLSPADNDAITESSKATFDRLWPDVEAFIDWEARVKPKWIRSEFQVFNRRYNYAGSVDSWCNVDGCRMLLDCKTSKAVYADYGMQLAAYRYAEFVAEPDGAESKVPEVDACTILHVRDGNCNLLEVPAGPEQFEAFKACRSLYDFDRAKYEARPWQPRLPVAEPGLVALAEVFA